MGNMDRGKIWWKQKVGILAALNLADLNYMAYQPHLLTQVHTYKEQKGLFFIKCCEGHHIYQMIWEAMVGEELPCKPEDGTIQIALLQLFNEWI